MLVMYEFRFSTCSFIHSFIHSQRINALFRSYQPTYKKTGRCISSARCTINLQFLFECTRRVLSCKRISIQALVIEKFPMLIRIWTLKIKCPLSRRTWAHFSKILKFCSYFKKKEMCAIIFPVLVWYYDIRSGLKKETTDNQPDGENFYFTANRKEMILIELQMVG